MSYAVAMNQSFACAQFHQVRFAGRKRFGWGIEGLEQRRLMAISGFVEDFTDDANPALGGFDTAADGFQFNHSFSGFGSGSLNLAPHPQALLMNFPGDSPVPLIDEITFSGFNAPSSAVHLATLDFLFPFADPFRSGVVFISDIGGQPIRSASVPITVDDIGLIRVTMSSNQLLGDGLPLGPITAIQIVSQELFFVDDVNVLVDIPQSTTPPVAVDDHFRVPSGGQRDLDVLRNDSDADGDSLSAVRLGGPTADTGPVAASVQLHTGGTSQTIVSRGVGDFRVPFNGIFDYAAPFGFAGIDTFTYLASDGVLESGIATVTIQVNAPPVAQDFHLSVVHNVTLRANSLHGDVANDIDLEGDRLKAIQVSNAAHGQLFFFDSGNFTYVPDPGFVGPDSFSYQLDDGLDHSNLATVFIDVTNRAPTAVDDFESIPPGFFGDYSVTVPGVRANDPPDPDGDVVTAQLVVDATRGHVALNADGSYTYSPFDDGPVRSDTFTYQLSDGHDIGNIATVHLIVANQPPVASDDGRNMRLVRQTFGQFFGELTGETYLVSGPSVLDNDSDHAGDTLSIPSFVPGAQGEIARVFADGSMHYERQAAPLTGLPPFSGQDVVTYITDDGLAVSNVATVTLTAVPNSVPVANNDSYTILRNSVLDVSFAVLGVIGGFLPTPPFGGIGNLAGADTDADGDALTAALVADPAHGTLSLQSDGRFTYTPDAGFLGDDTFQYQVSDGFLGGQSNVASVTIHVISPDTDQDGIRDSVEEAAPNGGDANNDGIADSRQANVVSLPNAADGRFVTLVGPPGTTFSNVAAVVPAAALPERVLSLIDFFSFELSGIAPGGSATVVATLPPGVNPNAYFKYGPTPTNVLPHWYLFNVDGPTGAEIVGNLAILHFVDGQRGDDDLTANGIIVDPGGPVFVLSATAPEIESVVINDGHAQRSKINSISVKFDSAVTLEPGAFELVHDSGVQIALAIAASQFDGRSVAILTFSSPWLVGGSLFNGDYTLVVHGDKIRNQAGVALDGDNDGAAGGDHREEFFRRFGDSDGDGDVDRLDRNQFLSTFLRRAGDPRYLWYFDWNDDGRIAVLDLLAVTVASLSPHR